MFKKVKSKILLLNDVLYTKSFYTEAEADIWIKQCFSTPTGKLIKSWEIIGTWNDYTNTTKG
jgi:hypothetical protein